MIDPADTNGDNNNAANNKRTDSSSPDRLAFVPGQIVGPDDLIVLNEGKRKTTMTVVNRGDRPIQVGSHYHFAETNPALHFDRLAALGFRLDIIAGTSTRFEPGIETNIELVELGGKRIVAGLRSEVAGPVDKAIADAKETHG